MIVLVVAAAALAVALAASLASGRDGVVAGAGAVLFVLVGAYQATGSDDGDGEAINGAAGFALWFVWLLAPWLIGIVVARVIRRRRD